MTECPTCGRDDFSSKRGMKVHHKRSHGESISGDVFNCSYCGEESRTKPYKLDKFENNFCSKDCKYKHLSENKSGEDHHQYDRVGVECNNCGNIVEKRPSVISRGHKSHFCNLECRNEYYRDGNIPSGSDHPSWTGGYSKDYGSTWRRKRQEILELDGYTCQNCGNVEKQLHVHHITPVRKFDNVNNAHYNENLVTLCCDCHPDIESLSTDTQIERLNVPRLEV